MPSTKKPFLAPEVFPHPVYLRTVLKPNFQHSVQFFFRPLLEVNQAHAIMLAECRIISRSQGARLLKGLRQLSKEQKTLKEYVYSGAEEDLFFYVEKRLTQICGEETAGQLSVARSRNDVDMTLYRMVLREELLQTASRVSSLEQTLLELVRTHIATILPVVTHTQLAQPTTLGHYLMAAAEFLERDFSRLIQTFERVNQCPLGACVATTTGFPINRDLLAHLLGFDGVLENSYGCIASVDYLVETAGALSSMMVNLGRFIQDLLLWSSQDVGLIRLSDGFVQSSSIMPQKRNPVALEHLRILASNALAQCQSIVLDLHNTPFGDIVDTEDDLQPVVRTAFQDSFRVLELLSAVLQSAQIDSEKALLKCQTSDITLTELADWLVRHRGLPFRAAHHVVSLVAGEMRRQPARRVGESLAQRVSELLESASSQLLKRGIRVSPSEMARILDPTHFVKVRRVFGGPAPQVVKRSLDRQAKLLARKSEWLAAKQQVLRDYHLRLRRLEHALA